MQSLALQQTLYQMGKAVLETYPMIAEVRLSLRRRDLDETLHRA